MDKILIFIPMYNCEKQIPRVLHRIAALGEAQRLFSQVLVVDNRSTDGSLHAAGEAAGAGVGLGCTCVAAPWRRVTGE